jgi:hypothetical protein
MVLEVHNSIRSKPKIISTENGSKTSSMNANVIAANNKHLKKKNKKKNPMTV